MGSRHPADAPGVPRLKQLLWVSGVLEGVSLSWAQPMTKIAATRTRVVATVPLIPIGFTFVPCQLGFHHRICSDSGLYFLSSRPCG